MHVPADALTAVVAGAVSSWVLERAKDWAWFPLMQRVHRYKAPINLATALVTTVAVAGGIHWTFADGTLSISGLVPNEIVHNLVLWLLAGGANQGLYALVKAGQT